MAAASAMCEDEPMTKTRLQKAEDRLQQKLKAAEAAEDEHGRRSKEYLQACADAAFAAVGAARAKHAQALDEGQPEDFIKLCAAEAELADAKAELADVKAKLADAEAKLADAEVKGKSEETLNSLRADVTALRMSVNLRAEDLRALRPRAAARGGMAPPPTLGELLPKTGLGIEPTPPLVGRDEAVEAIKSVARRNFMFRRSADDKGKFAFLAAPGHVRVGKTRLGLQTPHIVNGLRGELDKMETAPGVVVIEPVYIKIDFSNGEMFLPEFDPSATAQQALAARLGMASLAVDGDHTALRSPAEVLAHIVNRALDQHARAAAGGSEETRGKLVVPIVIHFDEYGLYETAMKKAGPDVTGHGFFKALLRQVGSLMFRPSDPHLEELKSHGQYFVVPICSGTSFGDVRLELSDYVVHPICLSTLSFDDSKKMARALLSVSSSFRGDYEAVVDDDYFQIALGDTGGIPGFIDMLCQDVPTVSSSYAAELDKKVFVYMNAFDKRNRDHLIPIVRLALARATVERADMVDDDLSSPLTIGDLADRGFVHLQPQHHYRSDFCVSVAPVMLRMWSFGLVLVEAVAPAVSRADPWTWQRFERMHAYAMAARLSAMQACGRFKDAKLGDVLAGAQPSDSPFLAQCLQLHEFAALKVVAETEQCTRTGHVSVDFADLEHVHLCADGNPIVDAYFNVMLADGSTCTVFLQDKHSKLSVDGKVRVSEMNREFDRLSAVLKETRRAFVLVFVTNRTVEGLAEPSAMASCAEAAARGETTHTGEPKRRRRAAEGADASASHTPDAAREGLLWIGRRELETHLGNLAVRGLVAKEPAREAESA